MNEARWPKAVLFDLLTALLDSWSVWNAAVGSAAEGRAWRNAYLRLTYGCGSYRPYEDLVHEAARSVGLPKSAPEVLFSRWTELSPWSGAQTVLNALQNATKLAIVTNCSEHLGALAASRLDARWDCVITAERAGYYKPHPRPYLLALETLDVSPQDAAFVAGSGYDLFGTSAVGLRTYWHNRHGLPRPQGAPMAAYESKTLDDLLPWLDVNSRTCQSAAGPAAAS
jgi:2-haloacid dehalogenase